MMGMKWMMNELECEEAVIAKIRQRRDAGRKKYGKTMERDDFDTEKWASMLQEELLDASVYIERLMRELAKFKAK